ncbi:hypothetical protein BRE01_68030 [Brevibacillus reuszeri]|uniref:Cadherin domain-containing protein n=1 Tax=Brevibacillus reuszeri TaxID=54915 RepID=A0A0K9YUB8_9BACL|nr:hypothetical protein [Brevibacillus reuszeri]KNB72276.1 hypothetical protein ADS79_10255 [Brevibacillus reuszeri]MED1855930.1 hypothetical protein [Brevibacillus reuszeri]GED73101.1 hypothetical protein BRE01_68030 [Brevibacillus reuszeri]
MTERAPQNTIAMGIPLIPYFSDPDSDALTFTAVSDNARFTTMFFPGYANLNVNFPSDPAPNIGDTVTITVTANDGKGGIVSSKLIIKIVEPI